MGRIPLRLDHSRRRQCIDAEGLYPAASGKLAAPYRPCLLNARGLAAAKSLGRTRMRFLNTFEARWQYCAEAIGLGFAQGKSMLWRREVIDRGGGIRALNSEIIEDAAATKLVRHQGLTVNLVVGGPFEQPLGVRGFRDVWLRQARWARTRRKTFPLFFAPEIFAGAALPALRRGLFRDQLRSEHGSRAPWRRTRLVCSGNPSRPSPKVARVLAHVFGFHPARSDAPGRLHRCLVYRSLRLARQ